MAEHIAPHYEQPEIMLVEEQKIHCDGSGGALGHPRVYLTLGHDGTVDCPYCDRRFQLKPGAKISHHH